MDAVAKGSESSSQAGGSGRLKRVVSVGLGLALGALAGVFVGMAAGFVIAMLLGVI